MSESKQNNVKLYLSNKSAGSSKVYARVKTWRGDGPVSEGTSERRRLCPGLWAGARDIHDPDLGTDEKWQLWGHTTSVQLEEWRKGEDIRMKRGGGHPGADSLMWFAFRNKPLWFLSFLSFLGQSYRFHCRAPHVGFLCCALSTQSYFIYMILTQEQIPHLAAKHMLSVRFPINHYNLPMSPHAPRHATGIGI